MYTVKLFQVMLFSNDNYIYHVFQSNLIAIFCLHRVRGSDNSKISGDSIISGNKNQIWHKYSLGVAFLIKLVSRLKI